MASPKRRIIIDTDAGVDDAVALAMAMRLQGRYDYKLALTTCHGNVNVEQVNRNVVTIRDACDLEADMTPSIFGGAAQNLRGN